MKVYQIVMKGDERSEKYAEISRESFRNLIDDGTLEFHTFDAITPEHPDFEEIISQYDWRPSLAIMDSKKKPEDHSPTEKAGMCSHWELMRRQGESKERFLIMEHDTYLLSEHEQEFRNLLSYIEEKDICYANIGLFMGCYSFTPHCAEWQYELLSKQKFWINGGPYGVLERLFKNYIVHYLSKRDFLGKENIVIHPWGDCDTLYFGRDIYTAYNTRDPDPQNSIPNPTTQVVSKSLKVTQDHHGYVDKHIEKPWTRHHYMKIVP
jgi:GR25 family glycosyltransferase involved in LPS biosynthesis